MLLNLPFNKEPNKMCLLNLWLTELIDWSIDPCCCFLTHTEGKKHDAAMLKDSGLLDDLERNAFSPVTGEAMCIYGDPAYPLRLHLQQPFREAPPTAPMEQFNKSMSSVRSSVEWIFGDIVASFKFLDFKKNLKIGLSAIGKHYVVSALLRNALTCMYGNTTATFFDIEPPSSWGIFRLKLWTDCLVTHV